MAYGGVLMIAGPRTGIVAASRAPAGHVNLGPLVRLSGLCVGLALRANRAKATRQSDAVGVT